MSNLTDISIATRKIAVWMVVLFVVYLIVQTLIGLISTSIQKNQPIIVVPPDTRFQKLPPIKFEGIATSSSGFKFNIQTIEGLEPETTDSARIFKMPKRLPNIQANNLAIQFAKKLGFTSPPQTLNATTYRFINLLNPFQTFELETTEMHFLLQNDFRNNLQLLLSGEPLNVKEVTDFAIKYLQKNDLFDSALLEGKMTTDFLKVNRKTKELSKVVNIYDADLVRLNFFRNDLDQLKIVSPHFFQSENYVLVGYNANKSLDIFEISYSLWPIAFDDFATYPLKTGKQAFQDLFDGYAVIANMGGNKPDNIVIRNISLAYYDSKQSQPFLQPIFVFEGDDDFVAYLAAVDPIWQE